jgi:uncharacterized membrane protein YkvA (DUF1232 family)
MTARSRRRTEHALPRNISPADEQKVLKEFKTAERAARSRGAGHDLLDAVASLWQMLTDSSYSIPASTWGWIVLALGYFIMPLDAIPDPIPVLGYLDDAAVVGWVASMIAEDIAAYKCSKQ